MEDFEIRKIIKQVIREELTQIFMGKVTETTPAFRASARRFSSEPPIGDMRLIQPYGLASRPKPNMESLLVPVNGDATHINLVGQNDTARPACEEGEVALYGPNGQVLKYFNSGKVKLTATNDFETDITGKTHFKSSGDTDIESAALIHLGAPSADEPFVLGTKAKTWLGDLVDAIRAIVYYGNLGAPVTVSTNDAAFAALKARLDEILSEQIFGQKS